MEEVLRLFTEVNTTVYKYSVTGQSSALKVLLNIPKVKVVVMQNGSFS